MDAARPDAVHAEDVAANRDAADEANDAAVRDTGTVTVPNWLLTVQTSGTSHDVHQLLRVSVDPATYGAISTVCANIQMPSANVQQNIVSALAFVEGRLVATIAQVEQADSLIEIDPCRCTSRFISAIGFTNVRSITAIGPLLFGLSASANSLIVTEGGRGRRIATLPPTLAAATLTWSGPGRNTLYAINPSDDTLTELSPGSGATVAAPIGLDFNFTTVTAQYHQGRQRVFGCSFSGGLYEIDVAAAHVTVQSGTNPNCNTLAAPNGPVACIAD
ncbi:MAG: hypothetical protein U0269_29895 [Polyangiales bacterium]